MRSRNPKKPTKARRFECCICLDDTKLLYLNGNTLMNISDINIIEQNTVFYAPCGKHPHCYECLYRIASNYENHPINEKYALIRCMSTNPDCISPSGLPTFFNHSQIKKILNEQDFKSYTAHADKYRFPGFEVVNCPRQGVNGKCNAMILVPNESIKNEPIGELIITCDQNENCGKVSCYYCKSSIPYTREHCQSCVVKYENTNPEASNAYFYRVDKCPRDNNPLMYKNKEITEEIAFNQIKEIIMRDVVYIECLECLVAIHKTEQCNTMTHCNIERCYVCGRSGTVNMDLGDHWDRFGEDNKCPRYDNEPYWNEICRCDFKCEEGECYGDNIGDCTVECHKTGIENMKKQRKLIMVYNKVRSLLPDIRESIIDMMLGDLETESFTPFFEQDSESEIDIDTDISTETLSEN